MYPFETHIGRSVDKSETLAVPRNHDDMDYDYITSSDGPYNFLSCYVVPSRNSKWIGLARTDGLGPPRRPSASDLRSGSWTNKLQAMCRTNSGSDPRRPSPMNEGSLGASSLFGPDSGPSE